MDIREIHPSEIESTRRLLEANGWSHRVSNSEDFREVISRSQRAIVAVQDGELIGFLRALTDGMANGCPFGGCDGASRCENSLRLTAHSSAKPARSHRQR